MPGIFGFAGHYDPEESTQLLSKMASALDPEDGYCVDLYHDEGVGIGRSSLGIINSKQQPVWNAAKTRCIFMEGEVFDTYPIKQSLRQKGHRFILDSDEELLLNLYEEYEEEFARELNGVFVAAIWDSLTKKLIIVNDRLGLHPFYYAQFNGKLLFGSGVRVLIADHSVAREIDRVALAEFLTFDHPIHDRTLLESVRLMPQATCLTFAGGRLSLHRYYEMHYADPYQLRDEVEWMDEYNHLLKQAIDRQSTGDLPAGLLLSGGLDSRQLLAYLCTNSHSPQLHSFTWGIPGCDDARYAEELAKKSCVKHKFFELKPDWLLSKAEQAVRLTDGMGNLVNMHALATLDQEAEHVRVLYKGFLGDAMMGFALRPQFWANYDDDTRIQVHLSVHRDQGVLMYSPEELDRLLLGPSNGDIQTRVMDDYRLGMDEAGSPILADQRVFFDFRQRVPRMTLKGVEVARSKVVVRLPFADNDLVDFALRLPPGLRYGRRLQRNAFIRNFPKLAQIPTTDTGLPMMECARDIYLRGLQVLRWHLNSKNLGWLIGPDRRPYKNYKSWFQTELRSWVESILLDAKTLERHSFNPDVIRKMVNEHMAGGDHTVRLGALLSLELWFRQYLD